MNFTELNINTPLINALNDLGITQTTTIQERAYPAIMSGRDIVGIAQTGTGKTIAYLLPCLRQWKFTKEKHPQILIVVPTRELVVQVVEQVELLTKYMNVRVAGVYGGVNMIRQTPLLLAGVDVLVATPGRLLDFALNGTLKLKLIKRFVIDEVDEMLNLGFRPQLIRVIDLLPTKRQNLMFSATISEELKDLVHDFFVEPLEIEAAPTGTPLENIKQIGFKVPNFHTKVNLLEFLIKNNPEFSKVLVFTSTKKLADALYEELTPKFSEQIGLIHSNKSQNNRFETMRSFKENLIPVLIATDIVARGLDISDVSHVVNFDVPEIAENYMHRIGRTGRADKNGVSITFITKVDAENRKDIEALMSRKIPIVTLPPEVVVSKELTPDELPQVKMKNSLVTVPKKEEGGAAFHEKSDKNKKVNNKIRRAESMRLKYKKPKTRGQKKK
ncbi:MAG: DEAD/DEAH box helicase [Bacteroidota bacterium]|nr:DEAD/DEAH box helicase [Bacteroidota bacterium]